MWYNAGMNIGAWITLAAVVVALGLGLASLLQTQKLQKKERRQRLLNEIIDWANDVINCSSELNIPLVRGIDRTTMRVYGTSSLYFKYRSVNARSSYVLEVANIVGMDLSHAVKSVTDKISEFIKILEANIATLQKDGTEDTKAAENCELKLYNLVRSLIGKVAEVKVKEEGIEPKEERQMAEIDTGKELLEIKQLLARIDKRGRFQWEYNIGFAGIIASVGILTFSAWAALIVLILGLFLMIYALFRKRS